jgi:hypothetical protein
LDYAQILARATRTTRILRVAGLLLALATSMRLRLLEVLNARVPAKVRATAAAALTWARQRVEALKIKLAT